MVGANTPMSRLDDLPPDQRAALSLLLRRNKSYAEIAVLLSIQERAVHDRAHAALAVLAPREARELAAERREEIGDYLLGQRTSMAERLETRTYLERSAPARAWAKAIAAELAPLAAGPLPEIPGGAGSRAAVPDAANQPSPPRGNPARDDTAARAIPSSRLGGALLLATIVAGVAVAVILSTSGGGSTQHRPVSRAHAPSSSTAGTPSTSTPGRATANRRITLTPANPASKAIGVAEVLSEGSNYAFYLAAEHLPPSKGFFYAVWLSNSPSSYEPLGSSPPVGSNGRLQGGALLPANAGNYHRMLLTRETSTQPTHPGPTVLSGSFGLH
jgi:Sigma-70, region 4